MLRITLIFAFLAVASGAPSSDRVIGGASAQNGQFPWQVSLQYEYSGSPSGYWHFCGGTLISDKYIFTAAHCYQDPAILTVYVGSKEKFVGGTRHQAISFIKHPRYNEQRISDDYGIIELKTPVNLADQYIATVKLPAQASTNQYSGKGTVSGWGYMKYGGSNDPDNELPTILQYAELPILSDAECESMWGKRNYQSDVMLCAGANSEAGSCMGDSGGPFIQYLNGDSEPTLIGAVSWGASSCTTTLPSVFAKVSAVRDWIRENTGL